MAKVLDRKKPYGTIRGKGNIDGFVGVRFVQDGVYFQGDGSLAKSEKTAAPAAKAPAAKKAPAARAKTAAKASGAAAAAAVTASGDDAGDANGAGE
jgi:hypothetical protein